MSTLYEQDYVAWTQAQASELRRWSELRPNSVLLDWNNLIDEIDALGRSEWRALESLLENILIHLIKIHTARSPQPQRHWRQEITGWRRAAAKKLADSPSLRRKIDLAALWAVAADEARSTLAQYGDLIDPPERCPWDLERNVLADGWFPPRRAD